MQVGLQNFLTSADVLPAALPDLQMQASTAVHFPPGPGHLLPGCVFFQALFAADSGLFGRVSCGPHYAAQFSSAYIPGYFQGQETRCIH